MKWLWAIVSLAILSSTVLAQDQSLYILQGGNNGPIERWQFPNSTTRSGVSGLFAQDIGKIGFQTDTGAYYRLNDLTPTWLVISGGGGGSGTVTSITATAPIIVTPSPIVNTGTISLDSTSKSNWDTAYSQTRQWDGGATGLVAATGRTSLGLVIGTNVQAWDADLDAIAGLSGTTGLAKKTAAGAWTLDTSTYLTGNQTITLTGDSTGSGTTAITTTTGKVNGVTYPASPAVGTYPVVTGTNTVTYTATPAPAPTAPVTSVFTRTGAVVAAANDYTFAQIGSKPTTVAGYGITDAGTVTSFSAGDLSPLFTSTVTNATTTPAHTFTLSNAGAGTVFGNNATSSGAPGFVSNPRIAALINLTNNGFVKTSGGIGTLTVDTTTYETGLGNPAADGYLLQSTAAGVRSWIAPGSLGGGTVTQVTSGNLSPLFTTSVATNTTTPAITYSLSTAGANTVFGNNTGLTGAPVFSSSPRFAAIGNLTTNGFIRTGGGLGTLSIDTNTYLTANQTITLSGDTSGSGTTAITETVNNVTGTTTNDNAAAGKVGEYVSAFVTTLGAVTLTNGTVTNVTSISLTAGDWDVSGVVSINFTSATTSGNQQAGINNVSATLPADGSITYRSLIMTTTSSADSLTILTKRFSLASTSTIYLIVQPVFSAGTAKGFGGITARRVR